MRSHLGLEDNSFKPQSICGVKELSDPSSLKIVDVYGLWKKDMGVKYTESLLAKLLKVDKYTFADFFSKKYKGNKAGSKNNILAIAKVYSHKKKGGKSGVAYLGFMDSSYAEFNWSTLTPTRKSTTRLHQRKTHSGLQSFYGTYFHPV
jgi:hypothetical protein